MLSSRNWMKAGLLAGSAITLAACSTYPTEPRYPTHPVPVSELPSPYAQGSTAPNPYAPPAQPAAPTAPANPYYRPDTGPIVEQGPIASSGSIEGGGLPPAGGSVAPAPAPAPSSPYAPTPAPAPAPSAPVQAGAAYVIQQGDTISGVGRRFGVPVQSLIDLNNLGPRGAITAGQRLTLPSTAIDRGVDPYATGPTPSGVSVAAGASAPPPPPPPSGNAPLPPRPLPAPTPTPAAPSAPAPSTASGQRVSLQWPVRGEILRRFGPSGLGERNNGINIGASAGAEVKAAADGTVAYVGDDIVGQGLTVLIVHRDGWRTVYSHLGSSTVRDGATVRAGQSIGTVGLTAGDGRPSIHFEVRQMRGDDPIAIDPLSILPR
ncbi:M23 family metallopeptidase [uncultured Brevundimonas sp.]|uniref:M23 family metallopeptidase n=1 Tax=uncultured Brevundimonas sp. TaxID=213418 RepID=UPI00262EAEBB|nr:M23 family metallopeptidase [uncultured Brevundimonas sp.]